MSEEKEMPARIAALIAQVDTTIGEYADFMDVDKLESDYSEATQIAAENLAHLEAIEYSLPRARLARARAASNARHKAAFYLEMLGLVRAHHIEEAAKQAKAAEEKKAAGDV